MSSHRDGTRNAELRNDVQPSKAALGSRWRRRCGRHRTRAGFFLVGRHGVCSHHGSDCLLCGNRHHPGPNALEQDEWQHHCQEAQGCDCRRAEHPTPIYLHGTPLPRSGTWPTGFGFIHHRSLPSGPASASPATSVDWRDGRTTLRLDITEASPRILDEPSGPGRKQTQVRAMGSQRCYRTLALSTFGSWRSRDGCLLPPNGAVACAGSSSTSTMAKT